MFYSVYGKYCFGIVYFYMIRELVGIILWLVLSYENICIEFLGSICLYIRICYIRVFISFFFSLNIICFYRVLCI